MRAAASQSVYLCGEQRETGKSVFLLCTHRRHHYTSTERRARAKMCLTLHSKYSESGRCRTAASEQENNCIVVMPISLSLGRPYVYTH